MRKCSTSCYLRGIPYKSGNHVHDCKGCRYNHEWRRESYSWREFKSSRIHPLGAPIAPNGLLLPIRHRSSGLSTNNVGATDEIEHQLPAGAEHPFLGLLQRQAIIELIMYYFPCINAVCLFWSTSL